MMLTFPPLPFGGKKDIVQWEVILISHYFFAFGEKNSLSASLFQPFCPISPQVVLLYLTFRPGSILA